MATYGDDFGSVIRRTFGNSQPLLNEESLFIRSTESPLGSREDILLEDKTLVGKVPSDVPSSHVPLDLHTLWKLLERMDKGHNNNKVVGLTSLDGVQDTSDLLDEGEPSSTKMSTWELVVLQAVLLSLLILVSILWAFCCKRRCMSDQQSMASVAIAFARKISGGSSKDLPPSYSKVDLTSIGLTIDDHLNPPPNYDSAAAMHHLRRKSGMVITPLSERSNRQVSRFSTSSTHSRQMENCDAVVEIEQPRRGSRVHFLPDLEIGPTPTRSKSLPLAPALKVEGRKRSAMSEGGEPGSRKSSYLEGFSPKTSTSSFTLSATINGEPTTSMNDTNIYSSSNNLNHQSTSPPMI